MQSPFIIYKGMLWNQLSKPWGLTVSFFIINVVSFFVVTHSPDYKNKFSSKFGPFLNLNWTSLRPEPKFSSRFGTLPELNFGSPTEYILPVSHFIQFITGYYVLHSWQILISSYNKTTVTCKKKICHHPKLTNWLKNLSNQKMILSICFMTCGKCYVSSFGHVLLCVTWWIEWNGTVYGKEKVVNK